MSSHTIHGSRIFYSDSLYLAEANFSPMFRKIIFPVAVLTFTVQAFFSACTDSGNSGQTAGDSIPDTSQKVVSVYSEWHNLTESWTASLNLKNASLMKSFYADSVLYYGDHISADDVVKRQTEYFNSHTDYKMKISEYIGEEQQPDGSWRVRIMKEIVADGKTASYPASLIFAKQNGIWKIVTESDDITDINKARSSQVSYAPKEVVLTGLIEETSGFIASKDGDPKSNGKQNYFILWPSSPIDVLASGNLPEEKNIDHLQVEGDSEQIRALLNKKVKITGSLIHQNAPEHFTRVVLSARSIVAAP